jgi:hypothetical protein
MIHQLLSLAGAVLILSAYAANQRGRLGPADRGYNLMNLVGSLLLLWVAVVDWRWGFMLLEGAWAGLSLVPLVRPPTARGD